TRRDRRTTSATRRRSPRRYRATMRFVAAKTSEQLDLQPLYRVRERLVPQRTGIINQVRAFVLERGVARPARNAFPASRAARDSRNTDGRAVAAHAAGDRGSSRRLALARSADRGFGGRD